MAYIQLIFQRQLWLTSKPENETKEQRFMSLNGILLPFSSFLFLFKKTRSEYLL